MELPAAVDAATKKGLSLPKVDKPFVEPPADSSRSWADHPDAGHGLGMNAARTVEGEHAYVSRRYIVQAVAAAPLALMALSLLVLHAETKFHVVSYQIETFNASRTYALLSAASLLRALAGVSLLRDGYDACEALHRMFWAIWDDMKSVKPAPNQPPISKGRALQIVFSVTLRFAEEIFKKDPDALAVVEIIRNVLGVTALCGYAARNCSYHSCEVRSPSPNFYASWRRHRLDGVVHEQDLSITQALQVLEDFWNSMDKATSKPAVVSIFGDSLNLHQDAAVPTLILSQCGWCTRTGDPVIVGTVCLVSHPEITMQGMSRLVVSQLQRFLVYCKIIHCGKSGQKPADVGETQYLLDLAGRFPYMCVDKLFGLSGHTNVNLGSTVCFVPLLDASDERDLLMRAGVGVFQTLPLLDREVFRAIYDILKRAPIVTGDHGIIEALFGQEQKWVPGPGW